MKSINSMSLKELYQYLEQEEKCYREAQHNGEDSGYLEEFSCKLGSINCAIDNRKDHE